MPEMEALWRRRLGILENDCGCVVTRHDGTALNALIADRIRSWYASLLREADVALLPVRDVTGETGEVRRASDNCIEIELPACGVRPVEVKLSDWPEALGRFAVPGSDTERLQRSRLLRSTPRRPAAIVAGRRMRLYGLSMPLADTGGAPEGEAQLRRRLQRLLMVAHPETPDTFTLDTSLLNSIPLEI